MIISVHGFSLANNYYYMMQIIMSNALKFVVTISLNIAAITCVMSNNELTNNDTNSREQMCIVPDSSIEVNEKQGRCFCACALEFNNEVNKILLKCMYILYYIYLLLCNHA